MAVTLEEFKVLLQQLIDAQELVHTSIDAQKTETAALIAAVQSLLAKIAEGSDLSEVAAAVSAAIVKAQESNAKLSSDDQAVQDALIAAQAAQQ